MIFLVLCSRAASLWLLATGRVHELHVCHKNLAGSQRLVASSYLRFPVPDYI